MIQGKYDRREQCLPLILAFSFIHILMYVQLGLGTWLREAGQHDRQTLLACIRSCGVTLLSESGVVHVQVDWGCG